MKPINYIKESYSELVHKVSWPSKQDLANSAAVVLIASIILSLIVWAMDSAFENILTRVYYVLGRLF